MALRIAHFAMALLFFFSAALQYNDPDPLRWMVMYGLAGVAAFRVAAGRSAWVLASGVGAVALGWAVIWLPRVMERRLPLDAALDWHMRAPGAEEARELVGLLIVVAWMAAIVVTRRRANP